MQSATRRSSSAARVLTDGKTIVVEGGEYNNGASSWTTLGSQGTVTPWGGMTWAANTPPSGWSTIGDAQAVVFSGWNLPSVELLHQADRLPLRCEHLDSWSQRPGGS